MILNKYEIGSIINVHHKDYFLYRKSTVNDGEAYNLYYKGTGDSLSLVYEDCVSNNASDKLSNTNDQNTTFNDITSFIGNDYAYLLTSKNNGSTTTYKIYNFDGQALCSFDLPAQSISPSHFSLDNHVIIRIGSISILLNK
jgi:hypothetical protein